MVDTQVVNELIKVLDHEAGIYEDILKISKNKTGIIIEGKVHELENIVKLEQTLVLKMGKCETVRDQLTERLSKQLNMEASKITVSELIKHVDDDLAGKLKRCQRGITAVIDELRNSNELNSKLIKNSLEFINFSLNLISSIDTGSNNYGSTGYVNDTKKRNFFDVKL